MHTYIRSVFTSNINKSRNSAPRDYLTSKELDMEDPIDIPSVWEHVSQFKIMTYLMGSNKVKQDSSMTLLIGPNKVK